MKMHFRLSAVALVSALTLTSLAACSGNSSQSSSGGSDPKITVAVAGYSISFLPLIVAAQTGLFKKEGLNVSLITTGGGAQSLAAVASGSADVAGIVYSDGLVASSKGQPVVSIAPLSTQYTTDLVMSASAIKRFGITSSMTIAQKIQAAKGAKIAVTSRGSGGDKVVRYLLSKYGVNPDKDVTLINIENAGQLAALQAGQIDAFANSAPNTNLAVKSGAKWWVRPSIGEEPSLDGLTYVTAAVLPAMIKDHPGEVEKVVEGINAAVDMLRNDPDKAMPVILKDIPSLSESDLSAILKDSLPSLPKSMVLTKAGYQKNVDFLGSLGEKVTVSFGESSNTSLAAKATK